MSIQFRKVLPEILRTLRGTCSQGQLNRKLGFAYNQVSRWENGTKAISWKDFVRFCSACHAPLGEAFRDCYTYAKELDDSTAIFLDFMCGETKARTAQRLGLSSARLGRLMRKESSPTSIEIFTVLERSGPYFLAFLFQLTGGREVPGLVNEIRNYQLQNDLFFRAPWISLICQVLGRTDYLETPAHSDAWVARASRLPKKLVCSTLAEMADANLVTLRQNHYVVEMERFSPRGTVEERRRGFLFWNQVVLEGIRKSYAKPFCRTSWDVFNLSEEGYSRILQHWSHFLQSVGSVVESDGESKAQNQTYIMCLNLFDLAKISELQIT